MVENMGENVFEEPAVGRRFHHPYFHNSSFCVGERKNWKTISILYEGDE